MSEIVSNNEDDLERSDILPPQERLTSQDDDIRNQAWEIAYPILKKWGMRRAQQSMPNGRTQDMEDVVANAIVDFRRYLERKNASADT